MRACYVCVSFAICHCWDNYLELESMDNGTRANLDKRKLKVKARGMK